MMTLVAFVVVLGPLILFHELGHFIGAKLTGVRVEEFGLGWPPRLFRYWQSPSRFRIGGRSVVTPRNFSLPSKLQIAHYVDVVATHNADGENTVQQLRVLDPKSDDITPRYEELGEEVHIRGELTNVDLGTAYTVNWIPLGGFCRMTGEEDPSDPRSLAAQPKRARMLVLMAGPVTNLIIAILLFTVAFLSGIPEPTVTQVSIRAVSPDTPAAKAGLLVGDVVLEADAIPIKNTGELVDYINAHAGQTIVLGLERDGAVFEQPVLVRAERMPEGRVGISIINRGYDYVTRRSSVIEAVGQGVDQFWFSFQQIVQLPALLIQGQVSPEEVKPLGPVGISQLAGDAMKASSEQESWFTVLFFAGAISMALGLTNLLPLPALDGGRITFVLIEAVRGRRVDPAKEGIVHLIGMALLLGLMLLMTIQELMNPVQSPF